MKGVTLEENRKHLAVRSLGAGPRTCTQRAHSIA